MSEIRELVRDAAVGVGVADTQAGLSAIKKPGCAAVIWRRQPRPDFQAWIDGLTPCQLPKARVIMPIQDMREATAQICQVSGTPHGSGRSWLIDDTAQLGQQFANLMGAKYLRLRFDVVTTNACRKFHIDAVKARLICTYRGTGTQYGISTDGAEPKRVFTVPTGAPFILRGTLWLEKPRSGLLHRSPPIEGTSETRLLLIFDPVDDPKGLESQRLH